jgi:hypothetical protein
MSDLATKEIIEKVNEAPNLDEFHLQDTPETPAIHLDKNKGEIKFSGRSMPEDARSFYAPIKEWIKNYSKNPVEGTHIVFVFEYFNTASSKMIMEVIETIKGITKKDPDLYAEWHYLEDDDDMLEAGEDYEEITGLKFEYVGYE